MASTYTRSWRRRMPRLDFARTRSEGASLPSTSLLTETTAYVAALAYRKPSPTFKLASELSNLYGWALKVLTIWLGIVTPLWLLPALAAPLLWSRKEGPMHRPSRLCGFARWVVGALVAALAVRAAAPRAATVMAATSCCPTAAGLRRSATPSRSYALRGLVQGPYISADWRSKDLHSQRRIVRCAPQLHCSAHHHSGVPGR
jgi:hypothetical protein